MKRKVAILVVVLLALATIETGFLLAGAPAAYLFNATLEPQPDGKLVFRMDSTGNTARIYWNLAKDPKPSPGTYKGQLVAQTNEPPRCSCPDDANTCQCVIQPGPGNPSIFDLAERGQ